MVAAEVGVEELVDVVVVVVVAVVIYFIPLSFARISSLVFVIGFTILKPLRPLHLPLFCCFRL
jgi:hypothetical protein